MLEAAFVRPHVNQYLGGEIGRVATQEKNQRRKPEYKSLVDRLKQEREEAEAIDMEGTHDPGPVA